MNAIATDLHLNFYVMMMIWKDTHISVLVTYLAEHHVLKIVAAAIIDIIFVSRLG